jgi:hypothetical protein
MSLERISEPAVAYATSVTSLPGPVILEHGGQPFAVVLSYEEFKKLQAIKADEEQRVKLGWRGIEQMLAEIHQRPSKLGPEAIEAEITAVSQEFRQSRYNGRQKLDREMAGVKVQYRPCANSIPLNSRLKLCKKS